MPFSLDISPNRRWLKFTLVETQQDFAKFRVQSNLRQPMQSFLRIEKGTTFNIEIPILGAHPATASMHLVETTPKMAVVNFGGNWQGAEAGRGMEIGASVELGWEAA